MEAQFWRSLITIFETMASQQLKATYKSPESTEEFSFSLPSLPDGRDELDVKVKTAYLSALRSNIGLLQDHINTFLTQAMEKGKVAEQSRADEKMKAKEAKEEEMYGEDDLDDEG